MLSRNDVTRLAALRSDHGILSAYIKIDPRLMYEPTHPQTQFKGSLKRFSRRVEDEGKLGVLDRESDRILRFLDGWQPEGRGLVIFASEPAGIWEVVSLDVAVANLVDVQETTNTALLTQVLDEFPRFVVVLVQRDRASIYVAEQRSAREQAKIASDVPGQHDQGGWSQARFERHIEVHVREHIKTVVDELEKLYYNRPFRRLAVGGTEETAKDLVDLLPEPLSRRVIGTFSVDLKHETEDETLARARALLQEDERRSEEEIVGRVADAAAAGGQGVVGIEETIDALHQERVHELLVADGVTKGGAACSRCAYFAAEGFDRCPLCGGEAEPADDIVERAMEKAYLGGAHVETVFGEARSWLLARGGMAALLRY